MSQTYIDLCVDFTDGGRYIPPLYFCHFVKSCKVHKIRHMAGIRNRLQEMDGEFVCQRQNISSKKKCSEGKQKYSSPSFLYYTCTFIYLNKTSNIKLSLIHLPCLFKERVREILNCQLWTLLASEVSIYHKIVLASNRATSIRFLLDVFF